MNWTLVISETASEEKWYGSRTWKKTLRETEQSGLQLSCTKCIVESGAGFAGEMRWEARAVETTRLLEAA